MSYWQKKNVLITGCTGLVGSWLTQRLVSEGASVVGIVRDGVPFSNLYWQKTDQKIVSVHGDIADYELMLRAFNEYEIDTCFHLAAQTIVGTANRSPLSTFESNIKGTWVLLEAARLSPKMKRMVVASSDKAYGAQTELPYYEDAPLIGRHPYDVSKSCTDLISQSYFHTYGLPVGVARCGNIFGGGDLNFSRIIPETMQAVYEERSPVIRSDGSPTRDYVYVVDAAEAYMRLAEGLDDEQNRGEGFNFSYEEPQSVLELVERSLVVLDKKHLQLDVRGEGLPKGEIPHQYLSAAKSKDRLSWSPRFGFEEGLRMTYDWYRDFFDRQAENAAV